MTLQVGVAKFYVTPRTITLFNTDSSFCNQIYYYTTKSVTPQDVLLNTLINVNLSSFMLRERMMHLDKACCSMFND